MSRIHLVLIASLAGVLAFATEAQAGKKLYVGNLPYSANDKVGIFDPSTSPATELLDVGISLHQNPGASLPSSSSLGIVNPGPDGLGDAAFFDVFYTGAPGDFPANSFFDIFTDLTVPNSVPPEHLQGTHSGDSNVEADNFDFEIEGVLTGGIHSVRIQGRINPGQVGLSFGDLAVDQPTPSSFFDIFTELQFDAQGTINPNLPLFEITLTPVPEPSTIVLAAMGMAALIGVARKKRMRTV